MNMKAFAGTWSLRVKLMMRHTALIVVASVLLTAGLIVVGYQIASIPVELKIAVGPPGSDDEQVVKKLQEQFNDKRTARGIRLQVISVKNTVEAANLIDEDAERAERPLLQRFFGYGRSSARTDFAVVRRDLGMPKEGLAVAILRKNLVAIWAPPPEPEPEPKSTPAKPQPKGKAAAKGAAAKGKADAAKTKGKTDAKAKAGAKKAAKSDDDEDDEKTNKIEKLDQLVGRRVGVIGRSEANINVLKVIAGQYGLAPDRIAVMATADQPLAPDKINVLQFPVDQAEDAIRANKFDAIMAIGPVSSKITADAIKASRRGKEPPTFLDIKAAEAIAARYPEYESDEIKAGAFGGSPPVPEDSVDTISLNHYIVARRRLSDDTVADFTRGLFAIRASLAGRNPALAKIEKPDTDKDATVPVHPGAAAYLDDELKSFFDRYNDYLYWGLMLLSFFGSAVAGVASYSKADDRVRRLQALEQLLDLGKAARTAESLARLDEVQATTDQLMNDMIRDVEANTLDETALMAFSVTFDQVERTISERRTALGGIARLSPPVAPA